MISIQTLDYTWTFNIIKVTVHIKIENSNTMELEISLEWKLGLYLRNSCNILNILLSFLIITQKVLKIIINMDRKLWAKSQGNSK